VRVSKFPQLGLLQLWGPITLCANLRLRWGLKKSYSPCRDLFNDMWHATCTQGNWGNSWLLMVGNQIVNLTPNPSFGHNLCFKCPNGSCKPILNIYISQNFQWYKEIFNPMNFDPWNCYLKIWVSIETLILKVGAHLGVWGFITSHFFALPWAWNVIPRFHTWPAPSQALALVVSPRLGLPQGKYVLPMYINFRIYLLIQINIHLFFFQNTINMPHGKFQLHHLSKSRTI